MECFARHKKPVCRQGREKMGRGSPASLKKIKPPTNQNQSNKNQPKRSLSFPLKARRRGVEKKGGGGKERTARSEEGRVVQRK
ncbi:MAG: hypothetical protein ACK56P_02070 [Chitinophagales bacterium]